MIHDLEAFNIQTGARVARGSELIDSNDQRVTLSHIFSSKLIELALPGNGGYVADPEKFGLYVRDMTTPDMSRVRTAYNLAEELAAILDQLPPTVPIQPNWPQLAAAPMFKADEVDPYATMTVATWFAQRHPFCWACEVCGNCRHSDHDGQADGCECSPEGF